MTQKLESALADLRQAVDKLKRNGDPGAIDEGVSFIQRATAQVLGAEQQARLRVYQSSR